MVHFVSQHETHEDVSVKEDVRQFEPLLYKLFDRAGVPPIEIKLPVSIH